MVLRLMKHFSTWDKINVEFEMATLNISSEQLIAIHDGLIVLIEQYQDDAYTGDEGDSEDASDDPFLQNAKDALALVSAAMCC